MGKILKIAGFVVLTCVVMVKISAFHVFTHDEDTTSVENCSWCIQAVENQLAECTITEFENFVNASIIQNFNKPNLKQADLFPRITSKAGLFLRPPPGFLI
ncbi:hypothetical protein [Euzebyella saccharophila]|uniref:Saposin B-type domain-containing protein n=1 Tax=Euzebyella saccharophila TaxID=679664 RepID=A0ABV8JUA6_9FLAO|nr:hypothetical protein [Euzebyella saccharophila]